MFVGRKYELDNLNKSYDRGIFQFPVIYGRRRVGKTTLINEFCNGKKTIYFVAVQSTAKENLEILSAQILRTLVPDAPQNPFSTFREAIEYVFESAKTQRIILAIDEYPYLANSDAAVSSILQAAIDKHQAESKHTKLFHDSLLILVYRWVFNAALPYTTTSNTLAPSNSTHFAYVCFFTPLRKSNVSI